MNFIASLICVSSIVFFAWYQLILQYSIYMLINVYNFINRKRELSYF